LSNRLLDQGLNTVYLLRLNVGRSSIDMSSVLTTIGKKDCRVRRWSTPCWCRKLFREYGAFLVREI